MEKEYQRAVKEPAFRSEFVKKIDLGAAREYVSKVDYSPKTPLIPPDGYVIMRAYSPLRASFCIKNGKTKILVYHSAFFEEVHENFYDFYNTLVYHEGKHAEQAYNVSFSSHFMARCLDFEPISQIAKLEIELEASNNQIANFTQKNSSSFKDEVIRKSQYLESELARLDFL